MPAIPPKLPWLKPPPEDGLPRDGPDGVLLVPRSHGLAVVLFFQLHQHSRETGGGPGVMGTFPKHGSSWRWGHPQLCMAWDGWAAQTSCMHGHSWFHSALLCLAGVDTCMNLVGPLPWLVGLTFCDSELKRCCENLVSLGSGLPLELSRR